MTVPVFFAPRADLGTPSVRLTGAEGRHAAVVRRLEVGDEVVLASGDGLAVRGLVSTVTRDGITVDVGERWEEPEAQPRLVVVQALAKGNRAELAVEMLTEVGADEIVPWAAARSVVQWAGERGARAVDRWRATAREAAKQSRRLRVPSVASLADTDEVTRRLAAASLAVVLHESAPEPIDALEVPAVGDLVVVVGPEGGITEAELAAFGTIGAMPARLGPTVLRTSTAGVAAAGVLLSKTPRWSG